MLDFGRGVKYFVCALIESRRSTLWEVYDDGKEGQVCLPELISSFQLS